jgi:hypothetical protein
MNRNVWLDTGRSGLIRADSVVRLWSSRLGVLAAIDEDRKYALYRGALGDDRDREATVMSLLTLLEELSRSVGCFIVHAAANKAGVVWQVEQVRPSVMSS